jgi:hypothetical protein
MRKIDRPETAMQISADGRVEAGAGESARFQSQRLLAEWREVVGRVQQKDAANDEAVDRRQADEDSRDSGMGGCAAEQAAGKGGHDRVHKKETGEEHGHSSDSFGDSAEVGRKEKERELAWSFGAQPMDDADPKRDRPRVVEALIVICDGWR